MRNRKTLQTTSVRGFDYTLERRDNEITGRPVYFVALDGRVLHTTETSSFERAAMDFCSVTHPADTLAPTLADAVLAASAS